MDIKQEDTGIKIIEEFFVKPSCPPDSLSISHSTLYLLRREILSCLCIDPHTREEIKTNCSKELFATTMLILIGIDLLAKFLLGTDQTPVAKRFKEFMPKYFKSVSEDDSVIFYQLRNGLVHGFALFSEQRSNQRMYNFILQRKGTRLLQKMNNDLYKIDILTLHRLFEDAVEKYHNDLKNKPDLRINFNRMLVDYRIINIWSEIHKG